jgi:hypothetical protein
MGIRDDIKESWLIEKLNVADIELNMLKRTSILFNIPFEKISKRFGDRPMGLGQKAWEAFVSKMEDDDELWSYQIPDGSSFSQSGYLIRRGGEVIHVFVSIIV